jgi:hypothetical protein
MLETAWFTLRVAAAVALGFFLPGYCLARCLRAPSRLLWSFPLSLVVLFLAIFSAGCLGLPVTATAVSPVLIAITLALAAIGARHGGVAPVPIPISQAAQWQEPPSTWIKVCIFGAIGVLLAVVIWRTTLWPVSGFDNTFRWDFLARRMLQQRGFGFYPAITAADYRLYFYPDGIPPLVSFSYWWLYAATGGYHPALTSMLVATQLLCAICFTYRIARVLSSPTAGLFAAAIVAGSSLMVHAVAIGQETGLTALSVAAMICAAVQSNADPRGRPSWQAAVLAGLAAGLGGLSREYGCAFAIFGALAVIWVGGRAKEVAILCATAAVVAGPWYVRNALRMGNPFFSDRFGPFFVNPVHAALLDYYKTELGVTTWDPGRWAAVMWELLKEAPLQMTLGVAGAVMLFRKCGYLAITAGAIGLLWLYSVGVTAGGWLYSLRVLSPALVVLSIPAAILLARWSGRRAIALACTAILLIAVMWSIAAVSIHPLDPTRERFAQWGQLVVLRPKIQNDWWDQLAMQLPSGSRVLADDPNIYGRLQKRGFSPPGLLDSGEIEHGIELIPIWSPQVGFISDETLGPDAIRSRLLQEGIRYLILPDTINGRFMLKRMRFYSEGVPSWTILFNVKNACVIYDLSQAGPTPAGAEGG